MIPTIRERTNAASAGQVAKALQIEEGLRPPTGSMGRLPKKIGLLDHVGYGNMGDDATLAAVMHNIKCRWPEALILGLTLNPQDTQERHGITAHPIRRDCKLPPMLFPAGNCKPTFEKKLKARVSRYPVLRLILRVAKALFIRAPRAFLQELIFLGESFRIARSLDLLIISGGGQLRDSSKGPWKFPYTLFKWVVLAKLSRTRCYFLNVGAGPLKTWWGRFLIKQALRLADYTSFRDERSQRLIQSIGLARSSRVYADCVYGLPIQMRTMERPLVQNSEPVVGIAPMQVYWDDDPRVYAYIIHQLGRFSVQLARTRYRLQLFGTDIWSDSLAAADLHTAIINELSTVASPRILCLPPPTRGIHALLHHMSSMDYVVTCRFHGLVFAHLLNIPVLAVSHHPKMATLMNDLGLSEYWVDIRRFDSDLLANRFARMVKHRDEIKARMAEKAALYKQELILQFDELFPSHSSQGRANER